MVVWDLTGEAGALLMRDWAFESEVSREFAVEALLVMRAVLYGVVSPIRLADATEPPSVLGVSVVVLGGKSSAEATSVV